jgi:hypothetical protein
MALFLCWQLPTIPRSQATDHSPHPCTIGRRTQEHAKALRQAKSPRHRKAAAYKEAASAGAVSRDEFTRHVLHLCGRGRALHSLRRLCARMKNMRRRSTDRRIIGSAGTRCTRGRRSSRGQPRCYHSRRGCVFDIGRTIPNIHKAPTQLRLQHLRLRTVAHRTELRLS